MVSNEVTPEGRDGDRTYEKDVDEEVCVTASLEEDTDWWEEDGEAEEKPARRAPARSSRAKVCP